MESEKRIFKRLKCLKRREMLLSHPVDDLAELPRFVGASSTKERTNEAHSCRVPLLAHRTMTNYELNSPHSSADTAL